VLASDGTPFSGLVGGDGKRGNRVTRKPLSTNLLVAAVVEKRAGGGRESEEARGLKIRKEKEFFRRSVEVRN